MDTLDIAVASLPDEPKLREAGRALVEQPAPTALAAVLAALVDRQTPELCARLEVVFAEEHPDAARQAAVVGWSKRDAAALAAAGPGLRASTDTVRRGVRLEVFDKAGAAALAKVSADALGQVTALVFADETAGRGLAKDRKSVV